MRIAAAIVVAFVLGMTANVWNPYTPPLHERHLHECATVEGADLTSDTSAILRSEGWTASDTDGAERLYSPAC